MRPGDPTASSFIIVCPRCQRRLIGTARTCFVHGDQLDVGGREPALETVKDQLHHGRDRRRNALLDT
jgi:hypothetical protein